MTLTGFAALCGWGLVTILLLFWRSLVPEYLKEKGKNLAPKEDLDDLVKQVQAVTQATKEIETRISDASWDRQKQWEMKRETLFELAKTLTSATDALTTLFAFYETERKRVGEMSPQRRAKQVELSASFNDAASKFDNATVVAGVVCSRDLQRSALYFGAFLREAALEAEKDSEFPAQRLTEMAARREKVTGEIRRELGVDAKLHASIQ